MHIANEATIEHWFLPHSWLVQLCNGYYAIVHGPPLMIFLVWLFVRHRAFYPRGRNNVGLTTAVCLCMHFIAVGPPPLYPHLRVVGTAQGDGPAGDGTG